MDAVCVDYSEVALEVARGRARITVMTEMYDHAEGFESCPLEICTSPSLWQQSELFPAAITIIYIP
jgi:hypothetical protein